METKSVHQMVMELQRLRQRTFRSENRLLFKLWREMSDQREELRKSEVQKKQNAEMMAELQKELDQLEQSECALADLEGKMKRRPVAEGSAQDPDLAVPCLRVARKALHGDEGLGYISVPEGMVLVITTTEYEGQTLWYFGYSMNEPTASGWMKASDTRAFQREEFG